MGLEMAMLVMFKKTCIQRNYQVRLLQEINAMKENKKYNKKAIVFRNPYILPSFSSSAPLVLMLFLSASILVFLWPITVSLGANQICPFDSYHIVTSQNIITFIKEKTIHMNHRIELITKIEQYCLDQRDTYWEDVKLLAERGTLSEQTCKGLLYQIEAPIQNQKDFPNYLHCVPTASQLYAHGPPHVRLGTLVESPDLVFGIRFDMPLHIIIAGVTGFGKTTAARSLQKGVFEYNQLNPDKTKSVITFDRKANDYADLAKPFGWLHYNVPDTLRLSLEAPPGVPPNEWINIVSTLFCSRTNLKAGWVTVANALRWLLAVLNPNPTDHLIWPDLNMLLDVLNTSPDTLFATKAEYSRAARQPLEGIKHSSGNVFRASRGFQIERDVVSKGKSAVISMPNMFPSWTRQFFTDVILAQLLYGRTYRSHRVDSTEVLAIIDEADSDISTEAEEMFSDRMCPISSGYKTGREFGLSFCVIVSSLRSASRFVLSNATNYYIFRLNDAESIIEASRTLMLPPMGELSLNSLQPGECLVKQIGPWPHAMIGKIDYMPPCRTKPDSYDTHPYVPAKSLEELPEVQQLLQKTIAGHRRTSLRQARQSKGTQPLGKLSRTFLDYASLPKHQYEPVRILFGHLGKIPPATQLAVIDELRRNKLAEFERFRAGKSFIRLVNVTDSGWAFLQKKPSSKSGKGGTVHSHISHWCYLVYLKRRYEKSVLEWLVPNTNHACDVGYKMNAKWHGIEVVVDCFENLSDHIKACFIASDAVETLTMVTTQKSIWPRIQNIIISDPQLVFMLNRIKFEVAETYMRELWP